MRARAAEWSERDNTDLPYRIRDIAVDVGLLMAAATFTLLGGTGLLGHLAGITYPLSRLMVADAALAGFLAGLCMLGWLFHRPWLRYLAAIPLALITLYTLVHNGLAGGPWGGGVMGVGGAENPFNSCTSAVLGRFVYRPGDEANLASFGLGEQRAIGTSSRWAFDAADPASR